MLKIIIFAFIVVVLYMTPRTTRYLPILMAVNRLVDSALYGFLYVVIGYSLWSVFVSCVLLPLLNAVLENSEETSVEGGGSRSDAELSRQPHDEESLVPENVAGQSNRGFRGFLSTMGDILTIAAITITAASLVRPKRSGIFLGTYQVLARTVRHAGITITIIVGPPLVVSAPLLIIWVIVKRLGVEPHKTSWSYPLKISKRIYVGTFLYLLTIEEISLLPQPQASSLKAVLGHLAWQAGLLSRLYSWIGLGAYAFGILWWLTDKTASYFIRRGFAILSAKLEPRALLPCFHDVIYCARLLLLPIAMISDSYLYDASTASEGLTCAAITVAWATVGVSAVFVFDVLVYWTYIFWSGRRVRSNSQAPEKRSSPADVMAVALVGFAIRDTSGKTLWDKMEKSGPEGVEDPAKVPTGSEKLESEPEAQAALTETEETEKGSETVVSA